MTDMLIVLLVLAAVAVYYYGLRAAIVIVLATGICCLTDFVCIKLRKKETVAGDVSAIVTGLTLSLMMPASAPYFAVVAASVFAVAVGKQAFGGAGCEIFNAAAVGFLFISLCFPENILTYPEAFGNISFSSIVPADILGQSMTKSFIATGTASADLLDVLVGKFRGPMGTGFAAILAVAVLFLVFRRSVSAIALSAEIVVSGMTAFFVGGFDFRSVIYFLSCGMTLFGMLFLSCGYSTMPATRSSRLVYGIIVGVLTALLHFYSGTENAIVYAVIIAAPFGIELDKRSLSFAEMLKNNKGIFLRRNKSLEHVKETLDILDKNDSENK